MLILKRKKDEIMKKTLLALSLGVSLVLGGVQANAANAKNDTQETQVKKTFVLDTTEKIKFFDDNENAIYILDKNNKKHLKKLLKNAKFTVKKEPKEQNDGWLKVGTKKYNVWFENKHVFLKEKTKDGKGIVYKTSSVSIEEVYLTMSNRMDLFGLEK